MVWVTFGLSLGLLAAKLSSADDLWGTVVAACAFGNSTGMPLTILSALASVHINGNSASQLQQWILLLSIYQVTYPLLQWSLGAALLKISSDSCSADKQKSVSVQVDVPPAQTTLPVLLGRTASLRSTAPRSRCCQIGRHLLDVFLVPPIVAVLCGLSLSVFPQVRGLFVDTRTYNENAALQWLFNALRSFGKAVAPVNMLVLGASMNSIPSFESIRWRPTLAVAFCKLVPHPAVGFATIYMLQHSGSVRSMIGDAVLRPGFVVVAGLLVTTPTANNVQVMAEESGPEARQALAAMIFFMYCLAPVLLTVWIVAFLALAQLEVEPRAPILHHGFLAFRS